MTPNWKPSRTARKKTEHNLRLARKHHEAAEKWKVRRRDRLCRFPLCGCEKLGLRREVAHADDKGMGGDPRGDRSRANRMIYLCAHRHQFGVVSLHKGTLEIRPLTPAGFDGPVAFMIPTNTFVPRGYQRTGPGPRWMEVARERRPAEIEVPTPLQFGMLKTLGKMDL